MGFAFPATEVQVSSALEVCDDSIRTAEPSTGAPSIARPRSDQSITTFSRNVTRYASWPSRTVPIEISSAPLGDLTAGGEATVPVSIAASAKQESMSLSLLQIEAGGRHHGPPCAHLRARALCRSRALTNRGAACPSSRSSTG